MSVDSEKLETRWYDEISARLISWFHTEFFVFISIITPWNFWREYKYGIMDVVVDILTYTTYGLYLIVTIPFRILKLVIALPFFPGMILMVKYRNKEMMTIAVEMRKKKNNTKPL